MPVQAAIDKFGFENFSRSTQNLFKKEPFEEIELVHVVRPRTIYNERKEDKKNMPFQSIYFEYGEGHIINIRWLQRNALCCSKIFKSFN